MDTREILEYPVHGNFDSDATLWYECQKIVIDATNTIEARAAAVRKIDKICGHISKGTNEQIVNEYITEIKKEGLI